MAIKDQIKTRRSQLGMTLEEVATVVGVTRATIQKYESGVISNIPSDKIELLAKALNTTPAYIMGWWIGPKQKNGEAIVRNDNDFSDSEISLIQQFRGLTSEQQDAVLAVLRSYQAGK